MERSLTWKTQGAISVNTNVTRTIRMTPNLHIAFWHKSLLLIAALMCMSVGCNEPRGKEEPFTATFHSRSFSVADQAERKQLLHDIVDKTYLNQQHLESALKDKTVADCKELLSLADSFSVYGQYLVYDYTIRVDDPQDPKRYEEGDGFLSITVADGVIIGVGYDVMCR